MKPRHLKLLRTLLSQPTAPFHEEAVVDCVRRWAERRGVGFSRDRAGNVVLRYHRGRPRAPWLFTAHMDHPGFRVRRQRGRSVWADYRGSIRKEYVLGARVRLFAPGGEVVAAVATRRAIRRGRWWSCRLDLDRRADVPPGTIGMWDVPAWRVRSGRVSARSCDDVAGTAGVVCAIDEIASRRVEAHVTGLLTRAEEAGFVGAVAACRLGTIPADALVVGIECSKAQPAAPLGGGVVIRVGDSMRTFDASLTALISRVAAELARRRRSFRFTRQVMPGGACESSVYSLFGRTAAALALPLANYHNMGPRGRVAAEQIHLDDFTALVALLAALAADGRTAADVDRQIRGHIERLFEARRALLDEPS